MLLSVDAYRSPSQFGQVLVSPLVRSYRVRFAARYLKDIRSPRIACTMKFSFEQALAAVWHQSVASSAEREIRETATALGEALRPFLPLGYSSTSPTDMPLGYGSTGGKESS